jgi:hypothetical protein
MATFKCKQEGSQCCSITVYIAGERKVRIIQVLTDSASGCCDRTCGRDAQVNIAQSAASKSKHPGRETVSQKSCVINPQANYTNRATPCRGS